MNALGHRTILFDLDGTLLDSYEGLSRSYVSALVSMGRPAPPPEALRSCIGPPLRRNLARLLGTDDPETVEEAVTRFRARYDAVGWTESRLYEGVVDMLEGLRPLGLPILIVTAKPQTFTDRIVAHFALDRHVAAAFGPTLDGSLDDKRRLLAHVVERTRLDPTAAVLVGDRENDVRAALAHGAGSLGVTWGYGTSEELRAAGAHALCATPREVVDRLSRWAREPATLRP